MVKLIASDMDGTLLNSQKKLPVGFESMYRRLRDAGIYFVVASGRQFYTLEKEFAHIDHDMFFIAENGGYIKWGKDVQLLKPMKTNNVEKLIKHIRSIEGADIVLCGKEGAYVESRNERFLAEARLYYHRCTFVEDLLTVEDDVLKIAVNDFHNLESTTLKSVQVFSDQFQISTSSSIWLDVMPIGVNKGEAIKFLQNKLGISDEETMVFGDYLNDYEMLEAAAYSYAMGNAHDDIKKVARFQTKTNDEDGVMLVLEELLGA
ncbi:HAD family hydrolase [Carboxylicivirga caseinilyticus]|uniref:HAD family hydrolase n=1 Tax=Carboxylicivirga caseinilyticus TaxID=3417572 RepID=UPI003D334630|nr:HAD family hydrolase [Marinilabiliaceae bacterium A049]